MLGAHVLVAEPSCFLARLSEHAAQAVGELEGVQERVTLVYVWRCQQNSLWNRSGRHKSAETHSGQSRRR